ncbi:TLDc domain-containing protein [Aphelenchoides besseyi]|nr:TLDc domain-containing protein [Aphelenchoides besseyi]KAI6235591.1 TLDc domain-containing protein [Aphelenchoides besseyi]
MGHKHSTAGERRNSEPKVDPAATSVYNHLGQGNELKRQNFEEAFGSKIGSVLFNKIADNHSSLNLETFSAGFREINNLRTEEWIELFGSVEGFLDACLSVLGEDISKEKPEYVVEIKNEAQNSLAHYFNANFPGLLQYTILRKVRNVMYQCHEQEQVIFETKSTIITPLQFVLLQSSLSESVYFKNKQPSKPCWTPIYESSKHGLSVNRFESHVFGYNSPSVAIFKLNDGHVYAVSTNTEWKHSTKPMGTSLTRCFQLQPSLKLFDSRHAEPLFCNFKYKSSGLGVGFKDVFQIPSEFDNVVAIEVYGCGGESSLEAQEALKIRQRMQAERNQKVPLPGNWDENPDKAILELSGMKFSNERNYKEPPRDE